MYFSKLSQPKELRKSILISAKESLLMLSKQKELESIKAAKDEKIDKLATVIKMINKQIKKLDTLMPNKELKKEPMKRKKHLHNSIHHHIRKEDLLSKTAKTKGKKSKSGKLQEIQAPKEPTITDMDRLEYTLKKIEDKLASLE